MAIYHPFPVRCICGNEFIAHLAHSINAGRSPGVKQKIMDGSFHRVSCFFCKRELAVEKEFSYTDLSENIFIKVKPPGMRHTWKKASAALDEEVTLVPQRLMAKGKQPHYRVVFGLAELREKVLAYHYDIDDRHIELMKVLVMYEHPVLMQKARLRLVLNKVNDGALDFVALYDHDTRKYNVTVPADVASKVFKNEEEIKRWVARTHRHSNIFEMKNDYWVNIWRWSPQTTALNTLKEYAEVVEKGITIKTGTADFRRMLERLPRGNHLPPWAKQSLHILFKYAEKKAAQKLMDSLFEIRFNKILDDDWAYNNKPEDIDTIWQLFQSLPESHVEGNTRIDEITLFSDSGGFYDADTISMGAKDIGDEQYFRDTMRHEVGHAVHEMHKELVDEWLKDRFGWQTFDANTKGINEWVKLMGGWGKFTTKEQAQLRQYFTALVGEGEVWFPPVVAKPVSSHPWNHKNCTLRIVYDNNQQDKEWFRNYKNWFCHNGKAFFINYYYKTLCVINCETQSIIPNMPSEYSAMSPFEFFAELYAVYYNPKHPLRKKIPRDVKEWLDKNIG